MTAGLGIVFALLCLFGVVMGFRDAPNSVALPVRFRALTPRLALVMAALLNGIGVVLGMGLITLSVSFFTPHVMSGVVGHITVATAVLVAVAWGLLLWWRRKRSPSTVPRRISRRHRRRQVRRVDRRDHAPLLRR